MTKISNQYSLTNILTADLANSRLGINNVSPTVALDVTGAGKFSSSLLATSYNATTTNIFAVDGTERMRITSDGTKYFGTFNTSRLQINPTGENVYSYTNNYYIYGLFNDSNSLSIESAFAGNIIFRAQAQSTSSSPTTATERMRITSTGNVGIGYSAPTNLLQVNGTGYFNGALSSGGSISAAGTLSSAALSTSQVLYAANLTTFNYTGSLALTVPNALNSGSVLADIRMYMIWATGFGDASHAGARIWLMIMNGNGTAYSATELLGRDTDGGTGLSISRSAVNQITISSNGYGFIKSVSCMQLITN